MARRSDHTRDQLKGLILDSSWNLIEKKGFNELTARGIADKIGYAPGTIYNLFQSMDDLALHINARTLDILYDTLRAPQCNDTRNTPLENMQAMAKLYVDFAKKYRSQWLMLFNHTVPEHRKSMDWYQQKIDRLFEPLESLLDPYFSSDQIKNRRDAARVLWASVHGVCFLQETGKIPIINNSEKVNDMIRYLIDTFVHGIEANRNKAQ